MKKVIFITGKLLLAIGFLVISLNSASQEARLTGKEQKAAREAGKYVNYQILDSLLSSHVFILKADILENQYGERIIVPPSLNFIKVDSIKAILQTGSNINLGYNGVGGVTAVGNINSWKLVRDSEKMIFYLQFSVLTNIGYYDVSMRINNNNYVQATISGLSFGKLTYNGHLETIGHSRFYEGQSL
jgi:hypothetical protein